MQLFQASDCDWALDDLHCRTDWHALAARAGQVAALIRAHGIVPGERVALLMHNRVEFIEVVLGALLAGIWVVPVNWHLTASEIRYVLDDSDAGLVFSEHQYAALIDTHPQLLVDDPEYAALLSAQTPWPAQVDDPAGGVMLYTSGTTGKPKGVRRASPGSLGALFEAWRVNGRSLGLDGSGPHLVTGPLYHAAPLLYALYDLVNGAPLLLMPRFDVAQALALMESRRVHHTHWVPTQFVRALKQIPQSERRPPPTLRLVLHGAAATAAEVKRAMIDWWGPVLVEYWGGSESGAVTRIGAEDWLAHPGSVGRALPAFEIVAVDAEGRCLPAGEVGMLAIRHRTGYRPFHYHNAPEKTAASFSADNAFNLGDIGYVDADGYVFLCDRASHTIISGGVNIYPAEIEAVLINHPAVMDVAVVGVPDPEWGETLRALVQPVDMGAADDALREALLAFAAPQLARFKLPRDIVFVAQLPRAGSGKLYLRQLTLEEDKRADA